MFDHFMSTRQKSKHQSYHFFSHHLSHYCQTKNLKATKTLHSCLLRTRFLFSSLTLQAHLILSYAACLHHQTNGHLHQTLANFLIPINPTKPLPFNTIISSFSQNGFPLLALHAFSFMHSNGVPLDSYSFCSSLTAASSIKTLKLGKQIHAHVRKSGYLSSVFVGSALIDMYAKLLVLDDAHQVFDEIPVKNVVCANALISGFAEARKWADGLSLFRRMLVLGMEYDRFTLSALLRVCAGLSAVELGRQVHGSLIRKVGKLEGDVFLQTSLIDMYGRCGVVEKARLVFDTVGIGQGGGRKERDVVLFTSMLGACGRNGKFKDVIELFKDMLMEGTKPDKILFLAVISACGYTGNVSLGLQYFESMVRDFGLDPDQEHYSCVVDLLCRAGELEKAWEMVTNMPVNVGNYNNLNNGNTVSMWGALLAACRDCKNVEMGKLAFEKALELDPQNVGIYVLWSNLCASVGLWDEIEKLRDLMRERGLMKDVGYSWLEVTS